MKQTFRIVQSIRETTAEIWIDPAQRTELMGTTSGLNPTHLLLLRENSRPAWMLMLGNLYDTKPPDLTQPSVWIPTLTHPVEDALVLFSVLGLKLPQVTGVLSDLCKRDSLTNLDVADLFPEGFPSSVYEANQKHLRNWHVVISANSGSLAVKDLGSLGNYSGLDVEVRTTTYVQTRIGTFET